MHKRLGLYVGRVFVKMYSPLLDWSRVD